MLALGDQTLMDRTGQHRDAVPTDLVAEVLAGDADCSTYFKNPVPAIVLRVLGINNYQFC